MGRLRRRPHNLALSARAALIRRPRQMPYVETPTATAAVALTGLKDPSHFNSEDVDPSLIVDYNESTPLPSPHSSDANNELMRSDNAALLHIQTSLMAHNIKTASFTNAVPSSALESAATGNESAAHKGAAASPLGMTTTPYAQTIIHNGSDIEDSEPKAPPTTRERDQSVSQASRLERDYVTGGIPKMPPPSKWPRLNGPRPSLLKRALVDAHNYYGVSQSWRAQGKSLGRIFPIPVVLHSNETPDQYEAEFMRRIQPHSDVMKQRSQRINFARLRVKEIMGGTVPPVSSHYATSASPF